MSQYLGVDFGSALLKAAVCNDGGSSPAAVTVAPPELYMPIAVQAAGTSDIRYAAGWPAFRARRRELTSIAVQFRERVAAPEDMLQIGRASVRGVNLMADFLLAAGQGIQAAVNAPSALALALPDAWGSRHVSIPVAAARAGWHPAVYLPEWACALASEAPLQSRGLLLLSLGMSGAVATYCRELGDGWHSIASHRSDGAAGVLIYKRLAQLLAEDVIRQSRRDPLEDPDLDQLLHDSLDASLIGLAIAKSSRFSVCIAGKVVERSLTRDDLLPLADDVRKSLRSLVEGVLAKAKVGAASCPVIAWGAMAELLPLGEWLATCSDQELTTAPLGSVAAGAALLGAMATEKDIAAVPTALGSCCPSCGLREDAWSGPVCRNCQSDVIPYWSRQIDCSSGSMPKRQTCARVVLLNGEREGEMREVLSERFRIGRSPLSEWVLEGSQFPTVSAAHAAIVRDGGEYLLTDLESTNGTFVRGERVRRHLLRSGDVFQLGRNGPHIRFERT